MLVDNLQIFEIEASKDGWPPAAAAKFLRSEAMQAFRLSYLNYRLGHWKGAKGEVSTIFERSAGYRHSMFSQSIWRESEDTIHETSIFRDIDEPEVIQHLQELEKWRMAYRRFRLGASDGAHGEFLNHAHRFTSDQLRLLPVAALAECLAKQVQRKASLEPMKPKFHVHLGAGKLGLGLVLPAIVASHCLFAIVQRPSSVWEPMYTSNYGIVEVYSNDTLLTKLYLIRDIDGLTRCPIMVYLNKLKSSPVDLADHYDDSIYGMLVLNSSLEGEVIRAADAFSCSLGPGLKETLTRMPDYLSLHSGLYRPALYACENDHQAVEAIRGIVDKFFYVRPCMVDRICSDRIIKPDKISVITEQYPGEIIVTAKHVNSVSPAFGGPNVQLPSMSGAYSYLYNRKFLLVNGTHTTLAFMTLREYCTDPTDAPGDYELLTADMLNEDQKKELYAWTVARCLILLHSHEVAVIKQVHNLDNDQQVVDHLWNYAQRTIDRFSTVKDSTKRVLGGGVQNRYETRLKAICNTLSAFEFIPLGLRLLKVGNLKSLKQLISILETLVYDAAKFAYPDKNVSTRNTSRIVQEHQRQFKKN